MLKWRHCDMSHLSVFRNSFKHFCNINMRYLIVSKKKNQFFMWGWDRKIRTSRSPFVITQQASWCHTVIPRMDFSFPPWNSKNILILCVFSALAFGWSAIYDCCISWSYLLFDVWSISYWQTHQCVIISVQILFLAFIFDTCLKLCLFVHWLIRKHYEAKLKGKSSYNC